jgi:hypothetical protein
VKEWVIPGSVRSFFQDLAFVPFRLGVLAGMIFGEVEEEAEHQFERE